MTSFGLLSAAGEAQGTSASSSGGGSYQDATTPRRPLTPIIFAGPGSNLYPLCDPYSSSSADTLPKALLPVANRPLISFPLQQLVSSGIKHALVLAPNNQHRALESALRMVRLQVPASSSGQRSSSHNSAASASSSSNIVVLDGLSPSLNAASSKARDSAAIIVELLPLGPYDGKTVAVPTDEESDEESGDFRRISRPGTAELLRWVASIGKLESDPLVLPVDLLAPCLPLSSFLLSYYTSCDPSPPTVTSLLYERGAGESVGREREKEGPARVLSAWASGTDTAASAVKPPLLPASPLLLLSEPPAAPSSLDVRLSLLQEPPRARISTSFLDSHIYILRKSQVLPLLNARKDFTSIREHVLPFIAKAGWQKGLKEKAGWQTEEDSPWGATSSALATESVGLEGGAAGFDEGGYGSAAPSRRGEELMRLAFQRSSLARTEPRDHKVRAMVCIARLNLDGTNVANQKEIPSGSSTKQQQQQQQQQQQRAAQQASSVPDEEQERFFARANTLPTYLECNRFVLRSLYAAGQTQRPLAFPLPAIVPSASQSSAGATSRNDISSSAQLSPDTLLSADASIKVGDRSSLKKCIVSPRVTIGRNVRLAGCIIMEGASVDDGAKLENCILGPKSRVLDRVTLKDSDVGFGAIVKRDGKGEKVSKEEEESDEEGESNGESGAE